MGTYLQPIAYIAFIFAGGFAGSLLGQYIAGHLMIAPETNIVTHLLFTIWGIAIGVHVCAIHMNSGSTKGAITRLKKYWWIWMLCWIVAAADLIGFTDGWNYLQALEVPTVIYPIAALIMFAFAGAAALGLFYTTTKNLDERG